jgi:pyruvate dehydrogenase E1 component beta subunit
VTGFDITVPLPRGEHFHFVQIERIAAEIKKVATY